MFPPYYFKYKNYYPYYRYYNSSYPKQMTNCPLNKATTSPQATTSPPKNSSTYQKRKSAKYNFANINLNSLFNEDLENPIIEILGIKLYLDDLIILGILFFLYEENVHDDILFIILLLLLF